MQVAFLTGQQLRASNTTAYASGQMFGSFPLTFTGTGDGSGLGGELKAASCSSNANQSTKPDLELWLFSQKPASAIGDGQAFAPTAAELQYLLGIVPFPVANFRVGNATAGAGGSAVCMGTPAAFPVSGTCYGVLIVRNAYQPVSSEVITVTLNVLRSYGSF